MEQEINLLKSLVFAAKTLGVTELPMPVEALNDIAEFVEEAVLMEERLNDAVLKNKELLSQLTLSEEETKKYQNLFAQSTIKFSRLKDSLRGKSNESVVNFTIEPTVIKEYVERFLSSRSFDGCEPLRKMSDTPEFEEGDDTFSESVELLTVGGNFVTGYFQLAKFCEGEFEEPILFEDAEGNEQRRPVSCFQGWKPIIE